MNEYGNINAGIVLRIEKSSIHDGPGLRTVVFFKGCPLSCKWCSTPESQAFGIETGRIENGGGLCSKKAFIEYGKQMTVDEVVKEIMKDSIFYFHSDGGVTLSGGEVLSQADFAAGILKECGKMGINTAMETSLYSSYSNIEKLLPYIDHLYVDIKHMGNEEHKKWAGVENTLILENIKRVDSSDYDLKIHIRIPVIPSINDDIDNLIKAAHFCKGMTKLEEIELLPYHRLGTDTYRKLGREYELKGIATPAKEHICNLAGAMSEAAPEIKIKAYGNYIGD